MAKRTNFIITLTVGFFFGSAVCFGIDDYSIDNNLGAPRLPTSDARDSFVVPSPLNSNSDLVVTGNVAGGKHFRGVVPYRAGSDFGAGLGSGEIGSFLRRSAPISYRTSPGTYQPYYLPSGTVTTIRRGFVSGLSGQSIKASGGTGDFTPITPEEALALEQFGPRGHLGEIYEQTKPLSMSPYDTQRLISEDYRKQDQKELAEAMLKSKDAGFVRDIKEGQKDEIKQRIVDKSQRPSVPEEPEFKILEPAEALNPETFYFPKEEDTHQIKPDVFEQMRQGLDERTSERQETVPESKKKFQKTSFESEDPYKFSIKDINASTAKAMRGVHKTFATRAEDKFNSYMRAAEDLMKQGKFYLAANAYSLASLYKPDDPLAHAGKSHALFASGEYMSSAYFLAKAINMFDEYVKFKVDLLSMIGDLDKLENRIADVVSWQKKSGAPELQFLLSYVYYQTGKLSLAKEAIDDAAEKIPDSFAVTALKKTIDAEIGAGEN